MPLPPFLTESSAEPSVYICVQSACGYFSSSVSRVMAICCVSTCCSTGSRPGTFKKIVALRSSWFHSLPQRKFRSLICGSRLSSCVLLRSLAKWLRLCLFNLFLVGAATFLWSGWPGCLRIFSSSDWSTVGTKFNLCDLIHCHSHWEFSPLLSDPPLGRISLVQPHPLSQGVSSYFHHWVVQKSPLQV